jgi:Tfp pilus assembly protein PilO
MKAKTLFFVMIGLLILAVGVGGASYTFLSRQLKEKVGVIAEREVDIRITEAREENMRSLSIRLNELTPVRAAIKEILPKEKNQSVIVAQLVTIGRSNAIRFASINFKPSPSLPSPNSQLGPSSLSSRVSSVAVTLQSEATTYGRIKGFLADIKALQRHVSLKTLSITRGDGSELTFSADIEVHTDVAPPAADEAPAGGAQ